MMMRMRFGWKVKVCKKCWGNDFWWVLSEKVRLSTESGHLHLVMMRKDRKLRRMFDMSWGNEPWEFVLRVAEEPRRDSTAGWWWVYDDDDDADNDDGSYYSHVFSIPLHKCKLDSPLLSLLLFLLFYTHPKRRSENESERERDKERGSKGNDTCAR